MSEKNSDFYARAYACQCSAYECCARCEGLELIRQLETQLEATLTPRQEFVKAAMQGLIARPGGELPYDKAVAEYACDYADTCLAWEVETGE